MIQLPEQIEYFVEEVMCLEDTVSIKEITDRFSFRIQSIFSEDHIGHYLPSGEKEESFIVPPIQVDPINHSVFEVGKPFYIQPIMLNPEIHKKDQRINGYIMHIKIDDNYYAVYYFSLNGEYTWQGNKQFKNHYSSD